MEEIFKFLKECGTYYIATEDGDQPRVRPFGTIAVFENHLYIQTGKVKDVSKQMSIKPNIEISGMNGGKWIRVEAKVVSDDSLEAKISMLDNDPELKSMYSAEDPNTEVLYLSDVKATIYSFTDAPKVIEF